MNKSKTFIFNSIIILAGAVLSAGCETEQKKDESSSSIVSYNEDFVKNQAKLMNESKTENTSTNASK